MAPVAPGVLTTVMRWPRTFSISLARIRTVRGPPPPAGQCTTAVIGFVGFQSAAKAGPAATSVPTTRSRRVFPVDALMAALLPDVQPWGCPVLTLPLSVCLGGHKISLRPTVVKAFFHGAPGHRPTEGPATRLRRNRRPRRALLFQRGLDSMTRVAGTTGLSCSLHIPPE